MIVSDTIAFHALLRSAITQTTSGQKIVFDTVQDNLGGAYNGTTGVFTAPRAGQYVFTLMFLIEQGLRHKSHGDLELRGNDRTSIIVRAPENPGGADTMGSGTTVLSLNKGDEVYVRAYTENMYIYAAGYSYFSGYIIA